MKPLSISIVLPAFNEAENIATSVRRAREVLDQRGADFEIIVVDDGSSDATRHIVDELSRQDRRVRCLHHPRNRGYGAALRTGLLAGIKELVFFTDADLQFDLAEIDKLLDHAQHYDIIAGYRADRQDPLPRKVNAWAWGQLIDVLFDLRVRDIDCAFKIFHRRVLEAIDIRSVGAFVNSEILVRARAQGFTVRQVPVTHYARVAGEQTGANPKVVAKAFWELARLYRELNALQALPQRPSAPRRRKPA